MVNSVASRFGLCVVNAKWGPRGFGETFARAKALGVEPATVADVGASDGRWTRECMRIFPAAQYFLADPLPEHRAALVALSAQNDRVSVWHGALGEREGTLLLHVHGHQSSFYSSPDGSDETLSVPVRTLDSFIESHQIEGPMLLKADVQGFELEVLGGGQRCLDLTELLLLEVSFQPVYQGCPLADEVIAFLSKHGFRIYDICSYVQRPKDGELAQADLVFARKDSRLFSRIGWA